MELVNQETIEMMKLEEMPDQARLWVYQADRKLTSKEVIQVNEEASEFVRTWAAHGQPLRAAYEIRYDQFLVLAVDESHHLASGCSIDDSVNLVRKLEAKLGLSFLDRTKIAVLSNETVRILQLNELKAAISDGTIQPETLVINNAISSYADFRTSWIQPATQSWMKRYF